MFTQYKAQESLVIDAYWMKCMVEMEEDVEGDEQYEDKADTY